MTTRMISIIGLRAGVFGIITLLANQTLIATETNNQPQIYFKARFIEVPENSIGFILKSGTVVDAKGTNTVEIITAEKLRLSYWV